jgi:hypothetical protein
VFGINVAATNEFTEHVKAADAASELVWDVFGKQTLASRLVMAWRARHLVR